MIEIGKFEYIGKLMLPLLEGFNFFNFSLCIGGCFGNDGKRYVIGGWAWACACVTEVQR